MILKNYLSLVKFSHTIFALPFALVGFFWGLRDVRYENFPWTIFIPVLLCMVFARNAAMGFNRYIDRNFDKMNERTAQRDIPAGKISPKAALIFVIANCFLFCLSAFFINKLTFYLSPVALLIVLGYSYTKRFTFLCHFILGLGLAIAPTAAYISVTESFALSSILLSWAVLFWVGGFDVLYALPDDSFDKSNKLYSIPASMGRKNAIILSATVHLVSAGFIVWAGIAGNCGALYFVGAAIFIMLLTFQHFMVTPSNLSKLNAAFFTTNGVASVLFAVFTITDSFI